MLIADCANSIIGCISPPPGVKALPTPGKEGELVLGPIIGLLNIVFNILFIVAGLYAFFNLIAAGFGFISAGGDAKAVTAAWNKIQQTFLGIIIIVASFLLSAVIGYIIFGNPVYFLQPKLFIK
ncbi:hypothetical protein HY407_01225 [Candidatus Gottesmanbacteria bacterium]|nr:hypothetical protein [Candidatus Gottesmanbacteria bacterium]